MRNLAEALLAHALNLRRPFLLAASIALAAPIAFAQPAASPAPPTASFDVASIKPVLPDGRPSHGYKSLRFDGQITGLPDWARAQRYDITAKIGAADKPAYQKLNSDEQE
jgi:hypothetical protein